MRVVHLVSTIGARRLSSWFDDSEIHPLDKIENLHIQVHSRTVVGLAAVQPVAEEIWSEDIRESLERVCHFARPIVIDLGEGSKT